MPHSVTPPEHTHFGANAVEKLVEEGNDNAQIKELDSETSLALKTIRLLIADLCQQFNGGHPG